MNPTRAREATARPPAAPRCTAGGRVGPARRIGAAIGGALLGSVVLGSAVLGSAVIGATLLGSLLAAPQALAAEARAPAPRVRPLTGAAYERLALATENRVREQVDAPLRMDFHRRQAWRIKGAGPVETQLVSVAWWKESGGEAHCVLALAPAAPAGAALQLTTVDALEGEADPPPWSCEGEPAVRIADLDADGCPEVLAQYTLRPPSGEVFPWGVVLRCEPAAAGAGAPPRHVFDAARSARWREALIAARPIRSLREAEALLRTRRPTP